MACDDLEDAAPGLRGPHRTGRVGEPWLGVEQSCPGPGEDAVKLSRVRAVRARGQRDHPDARLPAGEHRTPVGRGFQDHRLSRPGDRPEDRREPRLCTGQHGDIRSGDRCDTRRGLRGQVLGEPVPQFLQAGPRCGRHGRIRPGSPPQGLPDRLLWQEVPSRVPVVQCDGVHRGGAQHTGGRRGPGLTGYPSGPLPQRADLPGEVRRADAPGLRRRGDEGADPRAGLDEAVGCERAQGLLHGHRTEPVFLRQGPGGGYPGPRGTSGDPGAQFCGQSGTATVRHEKP